MINRWPEWLVPTFAGMAVASMRRFRRRPHERWRVVIGRFCAHACTCMIAGYVVGGLLLYWQLPRLTPPLCALAGLYGTMLVDWLEEAGLRYLKGYLKGYLKPLELESELESELELDIDANNANNANNAKGARDAAGEISQSIHRAEDKQ